jgi:hypothetical protein
VTARPARALRGSGAVTFSMSSDRHGAQLLHDLMRDLPEIVTGW